MNSPSPSPADRLSLTPCPAACGGALVLAAHLLKTTENENVELHEVRGFMAEDVLGAFQEAEAKASRPDGP